MTLLKTGHLVNNKAQNKFLNILYKESMLMNLINEEITHKVFGEGNIVDHDESIITIDFNEVTKKFVYPDAFGNFITLNDRETAKSLKKVLLKREMEEEALERKREEEKEQQALEQQRREKLKIGRASCREREDN